MLRPAARIIDRGCGRVDPQIVIQRRENLLEMNRSLLGVLAEAIGGADGLAGAYTPAVACGLRAECTDHSVIRVAVTGGQTASGVDILDWYAPAGAFPKRPVGTEPLRAGDAMAVCNPYADSANMRASAGLGFPIRRTLDNGVRVIIRDGPLGADGYDWYEVNLAGDQLASGWVVAYSLRK